MKRSFSTVLLLLTLLLAPALCLADVAPEPDSPGAPGDGKQWETVTGAMNDPGERIPASNLVAAAYGFIWVMVAGFVASVYLRSRKLDHEIVALRRRIAEAESRQAGRAGGVAPAGARDRV